MIGSLNKILLAALLLSASAAVAVPHNVPHAIAPSIGQDGTLEGTAASDSDADVAVEPQDAITETSMNAAPVDGFGTLEQGRQGALPETIWRSSTRASVDPLLQQIRTGVADETVQGMLTRLLMTQATPPAGAASQSWFVLRVNALIAMGQDDKAEQMIASLPASMMDASLHEQEVSLALARGEYDHACEKAQPDALPTDTGSDGFWRKLSILCQAHAGKQEEAMVGIDLMREERHTDDLFFQEAIRRMGDKNAPIHDAPKQWTLFNVALLRLAGDTERLKNDMDSFPPAVLKYLAQDTSLDIKLREKARGRAQLLGLVPQSPGNITPEPVFSRPLASDVTTLVRSLGSDTPADDADNQVIARLALDEGGIGDSRRIERLLTLMEPFGYRVPPEVWTKLYQHRERFDGETPPASLVSRIGEAAASGRRGEVIVLAGLILSDSDVEKTTDLALLPVIKALIAAGFEKEARTLAHDAVKAYSAR